MYSMPVYLNAHNMAISSVRTKFIEDMVITTSGAFFCMDLKYLAICRVFNPHLMQGTNLRLIVKSLKSQYVVSWSAVYAFE
jgi:hypothetical protein